MTFLIDTNVLSEFFKPKPNDQVIHWLRDQEKIAVSVITVEEIYFGLAAKNALKQLEWFAQFLNVGCEVLVVSPDIAMQCGQMRADFRQQGITRTQADILIAATARKYNLPLATRNIKDFTDCGVTLFNPFESSINI